MPKPGVSLFVSSTLQCSIQQTTFQSSHHIAKAFRIKKEKKKKIVRCQNEMLLPQVGKVWLLTWAGSVYCGDLFNESSPQKVGTLVFDTANYSSHLWLFIIPSSQQELCLASSPGLQSCRCTLIFLNQRVRRPRPSSGMYIRGLAQVMGNTNFTMSRVSVTLPQSEPRSLLDEQPRAVQSAMIVEKSDTSDTPRNSQLNISRMLRNCSS